MKNDGWMGLTHSIKKNFEKIEEKLLREIKESKENRIVDELKDSIESNKDLIFEKIEQEREVSVRYAKNLNEDTRNEHAMQINEIKNLMVSEHIEHEKQAKELSHDVKTIKVRHHWQNIMKNTTENTKAKMFNSVANKDIVASSHDAKRMSHLDKT